MKGKKLFEQARQNAKSSDIAAKYYSMLIFGRTNMGEIKFFELLEQSEATGRKIVYNEIDDPLINGTPIGLKLE